VRLLRRLSLRIVLTVVLVGIGVLVMNLPGLLGRRHRPKLSLAPRWYFTDSTGPAPGSPPPDSVVVVEALSRTMDPELHLSVVDMGLLDTVRVDTSGNVRVVLILTTPECPYYAAIGADALAEVRRLPGARRVQVRLEPNADWSPERLTEEGKRRFRELFGDGTRTGR